MKGTQQVAPADRGPWDRWIASVCGIGYVPLAPGTAGSAAGLLLVIASGPDPVRAGLVLLVFSLLALISIRGAECCFGRADAQQIVIDEMVGMAVAVWWIPHTWPLLASGFVLFRLFDVLKPPPLRALERLPSPWGVLLDDVGAGVYANLLLHGWLRWAR